MYFPVVEFVVTAGGLYLQMNEEKRKKITWAMSDEVDHTLGSVVEIHLLHTHVFVTYFRGKLEIS